MKLLRVLPIVLIVFIAGCTTQISKTNHSEENQTPNQGQPTEVTPPQPSGAGTLQGEVAPQQEQPQSPPPLPTVKEFTIEADDRGFYMNNQKIPSISANKDELVKITFQVRSEGVYYGGLDFRGCGQNSGGTKPGGSTSIQFTASITCTITSYWPSSGVVKDSIQVIVQ